MLCSLSRYGKQTKAGLRKQGWSRELPLDLLTESESAKQEGPRQKNQFSRATPSDQISTFHLTVTQSYLPDGGDVNG
jgi:hypothetical protein